MFFFNGNNFAKSVFHIFILFIAIIYFLSIIIQNIDLYKKYDSQLFELKYNQSKWIIPNSKHPISDAVLYSYAGSEYIKGKNPILVNPEHPPFGKYLIGLSIILFKNEKIFSIIVSGLSLIFIYFIIYFATKSFFASSIAVFLTTVLSFFKDQIVDSPQLDICQLLFFLIFVYFLLLYMEQKNALFFSIASISFGLLLSIKTFFVYFIVFNLGLLLFYLIKKINVKFIIELIFLNLIALIVFTFTYFSFFMHGGSFRQFLGLQKWVFIFYRQSTIDLSKLLGNYLSFIFFNKWRYWTDGYPMLKYDGWSILLPLIFLLGLFSAFKLYNFTQQNNMRINNLFYLLISFFIVYNLFLFVTPIYPRYLLLLFIPLILFISLYFNRFVSKIN